VLNDKERASLLNVLAREFPTLNDAGRKTLVNDLTKYMKTKTYVNFSDPHKDFGLRLIGSLSAHSAKNPTFTSAKNTLNQFLDDKIRIEFKDYGNNASIMAQAGNGVMYFNIGGSGALLNNTEEVVTGSAHEVNHILNGKTPPGTPERFLDEYRAYYMQRSAVGENPPNVAHMKRALESITTKGSAGDGYDHLREYYKKNPEFKKVIDKVITDLNRRPAIYTTPEQLRLLLKTLPGNGKSPYLNKTSNMDNS
jgi:hypothetical protein